MKKPEKGIFSAVIGTSKSLFSAQVLASYLYLKNNRDQVKNAETLYSKIREYSKDCRIIFVLNQAIEFEMNALKKQFKYFFGNEQYAIESFYNKLR